MMLTLSRWLISLGLFLFGVGNGLRVWKIGGCIGICIVGDENGEIFMPCCRGFEHAGDHAYGDSVETVNFMRVPALVRIHRGIVDRMENTNV